MTDYRNEIGLIRNASSLDDIRNLARTFSAHAAQEGGILYSRDVGGVSSHTIAIELAAKTGLPIIDNTPRGQFLSDSAVKEAIDATARRLFQSQGLSAMDARDAAGDFQYGNPRMPARSATSLDNCLWGDASREFAGSLRGDVKLVASNANIERVFGKVELPAVLNNPDVTSLGGRPIAQLQSLYAQGGVHAVLPEVQAQFIEAAPRGIFIGSDEIGKKPGQVVLSREFATTMKVGPAPFTPASDLSYSGKVVRAPIDMSGAIAADELSIARNLEAVDDATLRSLGHRKVDAHVPGATTATAEGVFARTGAGMHSGVAMKGLGVVGAAATVHDIGDTYHDVSRLRGQGNATAAQARIERFAVQNAAGWTGAVTFAGAGALAGVESGPGLLVTGAIGGIVGAVAGDKVADWLNDRKINRQDDRQGNTWTFDPSHADRGWTRHELDLDAMRYSMGAPVYKPAPLTADAALSAELTHKASRTSIELALGSPPQSRDPYTLPANAQDARSLQDSAWARNPRTGAWQREVVHAIHEHGLKSSTTETASAQRAEQLDAASQTIIVRNAAQTPAAMAAQYREAHERNGWSQYGPLPESVGEALRHPGRVVGSDGDLYERNAQGQWTSNGLIWDSQADGNLRRELEATYRTQQRGPAQPATTLAPVIVRPDSELKQGQAASPQATPGARRAADPDHPDHALLEKIRSGVRGLDQKAGKSWDDRSERLSASLLTLAAEKKFTADDDVRVAFNRHTSELGTGQIVHVFRLGGADPNPDANRAHMRTEQALATTVDESYRNLDAIRQTQAGTAQLEQHATMRNLNDPVQGGPRMSA